MRHIGLTLLVLLLGHNVCLADSNGEFPGKGDYESWKKASNLADEGIELAKRGSLQQAITVYNQAVRAYSFDSSVFYNRGVAQKKLGDFAGAIESFTKSTSLEPGFASAWYNLGNAYDAAGKLPDAEKALREAGRLDARHFNAQYNLGMNLFKQERYSDSKEVFEHALQLAVNDQDRNDVREYLGRTEKKLAQQSKK